LAQAKIILFCVFAAIVYGIAHDQITARVCVEYFTVAHPRVVATDSPTVLGLVWGILATWWVGAALGALLAMVSQSPGLPPVPMSVIVRRVGILLGVMALGATAAGFVGYELSVRSIITLTDEFAWRVPVAQHHRFLAAGFAHGASYLIGIAGGAWIVFRIWIQRGRPRCLGLIPQTKTGWVRVGIAIGILVFVLCR
jgi:hypothetical protein